MSRGLEREKNLPKERYEIAGYFNERQWASYLFIISSVIQYIPKNEKILEIGLGGGYVSILLERLGYEVTTYDVNENLHPSRVADISAEEIPEEDIKRYGCVICAEVLEHIPFEKFTKCISNIERTCTGKVILTVPDACVKKQMQLTFGGRTLRSKIFHLYKRKNIADIHFWELNYQKEHKYENVRKLIEEKLEIIKEGDIRNNLYHHYYICNVK